MTDITTEVVTKSLSAMLSLAIAMYLDTQTRVNTKYGATDYLEIKVEIVHGHTLSLFITVMDVTATKV